MSFDMMHMPGPCVVCGDTNYTLSCGGPTICAKCDCGNFDAATVMKQAKVIADLREQLQAASQGGAGGERSVALAHQIHSACPHKINEPPNCALVKSRLECVCEHVHMHAIRTARLGDPVLSALVDLHSVARVDRDEDYAAVTNAAAVIEAASSICAAQASRDTTASELSEFIGKCWWAGATCPSLADEILANFEVRPRTKS